MGLVEASWLDHYFSDMARHGQRRDKDLLIRIEKWGWNSGVKHFESLSHPEPLVLVWRFSLFLKSYLLMNNTWLLHVVAIFLRFRIQNYKPWEGSHFDSLRRPCMKYVYIDDIHLFTSTCIITNMSYHIQIYECCMFICTILVYIYINTYIYIADCICVFYIYTCVYIYIYTRNPLYI